MSMVWPQYVIFPGILRFWGRATGQTWAGRLAYTVALIWFLVVLFPFRNKTIYIPKWYHFSLVLKLPESFISHQSSAHWSTSECGLSEDQDAVFSNKRVRWGFIIHHSSCSSAFLLLLLFINIKFWWFSLASKSLKWSVGRSWFSALFKEISLTKYSIFRLS